MVGGILCSFTPSLPPTPPHADLIMGSIVAAGGALCLVIGLVRLIPNLGASWHLHEQGIRVLQRGQERVLRDEEVDELTHKIWRVYFHGVCTGEVHDVAFKSHPPDGETIRIKQVRRPGTVSGADLDQPGELQQVCDKVAGLIAARMLATMARGEPVPWVRDLRLSTYGIETAAERIVWDQIENVAVEQGIFRLWRRGETQPLLSLPTDLPNFFPGYRVLLDRLGA